MTANAERASMLTLPFSLLKNAAFEPAITGPLLLALQKAPPHMINTALRPFDRNILATDRVRKLSRFVTALKWLFALGLASRVNQALSAWALNHYQIRKAGLPWDFKSGAETVVVTGECPFRPLLFAQSTRGK